MDASDSLPQLLERYERPLVRYAKSIVGDVESAKDVVQETFIRWVEHHERAIDGASHTEAWLFRVCRNCAIDHHRKHSRIIPMHPLEDRTSDEPSPSDSAERRDLADSLLRLLDSLSENQREVIRLKFQNDLSYKEIAEITQLTVTNVGFLLHTGLKKLRVLAETAAAGELPLQEAL